MSHGQKLQQLVYFLWNGVKWDYLGATVDPTAYLPLSGGTMTSSAEIIFALSAALADRIDGGDATKSAISNFTIDCGVYA